jgi:hypothetical protein
MLLPDFLLGSLFDPADGDTFPRNVEELVSNYMALEARKSQSSILELLNIDIRIIIY